MTIGAVLIFMEISTPFVVLRWLFFHHEVKKASCFQAANTVLLFITFIFGRVFVQAYLLYEFAGVWLYETWFVREGVPMAYKVILIEMAVAVLINVALNFYWSYLIVRQLFRLILGGSKANETFDGSEDQ